MFCFFLQMESGSRNHFIVPTKVIHQIGGLRSERNTRRAISELAKVKLVARERNAKYDGYKLTYHGYDYLALKSFAKRNTVFSLGSQIGIGKESDIFVVADPKGQNNVLKVHRLGRISFRTVKNNRDYLKEGKSLSWMFLSRLAAQKEFAFMKTLYENGFSVPKPIDQSRHCIIMSLVDGFPMRQLVEHENPERLYNTLMNFIVRLACQGLIHCDFNEFNIMIQENFDTPEEEVVVIDFPQCISLSHVDAQRYFERDVDSIRSFFEKKLGYVSEDYPRWERDIKRVGKLDLEMGASGFNKKEIRELEKALEESRENIGGEEDLKIGDHDSEYEDSDEKEEDYEEEQEEEEEDDESGEEEDDYDAKVQAAIKKYGIENLKQDKLGNYILDDLQL